MYLSTYTRTATSLLSLSRTARTNQAHRTRTQAPLPGRPISPIQSNPHTPPAAAAVHTHTYRLTCPARYLYTHPYSALDSTRLNPVRLSPTPHALQPYAPRLACLRACVRACVRAC
ncbi:uncharacterized protein K452DRAFT_60160 [Aplosporella prunicola CBS 121167]|uniref:Uncharacterized protein n=1 Tax=Aplosporella prunicola CBS 121167 TaxID=1176127 RepID=A0A6A6B816_9PEZI|nr:uncharacterized protein K452DRAFT_60160 [Aplosporella prunicola CBS 121167]KAF2140056.1 hypothetical protein K452DRAFT_60160 [Aplosporella prunicola CBS 121167]